MEMQFSMLYRVLQECKMISIKSFRKIRFIGEPEGKTRLRSRSPRDNYLSNCIV